jgi:hypothetical protein
MTAALLAKSQLPVCPKYLLGLKNPWYLGVQKCVSKLLQFLVHVTCLTNLPSLIADYNLYIYIFYCYYNLTTGRMILCLRVFTGLA